VVSAKLRDLNDEKAHIDRGGLAGLARLFSLPAPRVVGGHSRAFVLWVCLLVLLDPEFALDLAGALTRRPDRRVRGNA
jgi:hypothetical protein